MPSFVKSSKPPSHQPENIEGRSVIRFIGPKSLEAGNFSTIVRLRSLSFTQVFDNLAGTANNTIGISLVLPLSADDHSTPARLRRPR
jgi:hypothetical protein